MEGPRHRNKSKASVVIPRSDSVGSGSGRKYLAPTLSDPATRPDKERATNKKRNNRPQGKLILLLQRYDLEKIQCY